MGGFGGRPFGRGPFGPESSDVDSFGDGAADGHATASGGGASVSAQPGSAAGDATASATGASNFEATGAAVADAIAAAIGDGRALLVGSADCDATAAAISTFGVQGDAAGSATCLGIGDFRLRTVKVISTDLGGRIRTIEIGQTAAIGSASQSRSATAFGVTPAITSATRQRAKTTVC